MSSERIIEAINASGADVLAVFLSASKAQAWLVQNHERIQVPAPIGVRTPCRFTPWGYWIRQSFNEAPLAINSLTQRGCLPRPDHVSEASSGFRNFGSTFG